jgi:hypothetical protein
MGEVAALGEKFEVLQWDSDFLGRGIGRIHVDGLTPDEIRATEAAAKAAGVECLYADIDPSDPRPTYELQKLNYRFVESSTTFILAVDHPRSGADPDIEIRPARLDDVPLMEETAAVLAPWTRFAVDPHFGLDVAVRMQMASIERAVRSDVAERQALVSVEDGEVTALVGMHRSPAPYVDTVATVKKGSGAARAIMNVARDWAGDEALYAGTTASRNRNIFRYLQNCGFKVHSVQYRFHRWFDED